MKETRKTYIALARVSSREQEREGFSLEVQDESLHRFAKQQDGTIVKFWKIAETASKKDERKAFKEVIAYAKKHASELDGVLFFKVDRAARNLFDYVELERLEVDHDVPVIYVTQPTENTPAGRMMRRTLANMAAFYTEQQSIDVRQGQARRVEAGLFPCRASYGYVNVRRDGRGLVDVHSVHGRKVARIFELCATGRYTIDSLQDALLKEGIVYTDACRTFTRSKLHSILHDRAYIGDVKYRDQWYPGTHPSLTDRPTFDRVQLLMRGCIYKAHELTYGSELIECAHCEHPITGEIKTKPTKAGPKEYVYYRCSRYTAAGHPRQRVTESRLDEQVLDVFDRMRIQDQKQREWFLQVLRARRRDGQRDCEQKTAELNRQLTSVRNQQDRLLNLRLLDEINEQTFARKSTEFRDLIAGLQSQVQESDGGDPARGATAENAFELSQTLRQRWITADPKKKRQLLEIVCLNLKLEGVTLVPTIRKPFAILAEGLNVLLSRGDRI